MGQSQRTFKKIAHNSEAMRLRTLFQGKCGKHEGEYYFVTTIGCFYKIPQRTLLIAMLTPKAEGPNGVEERDLRELLDGAVELPRGTTVSEVQVRIR
jgi:hypothetical protein